MSRYDFEDWLKGTISGNQVREEYIKYETTGEGLPPGAYGQIMEAQKKTFDQAVDIMTDRLKEKAKGKPTQWVELKIKEVENFLSDHSDLVLKQLEGKRRLLHITGRNYKEAQRMWEKHNEGERVYLIIPDGKTPSKLQRVYAYKKYLPFLKKLNGDEQSEKKEKRGNPDMKKNKIPKPETFEDDLKKIMGDNPEWTQAAYAESIIDKHDHLTGKNMTTVKRWIRESPHWD